MNQRPADNEKYALNPILTDLTFNANMHMHGNSIGNVTEYWNLIENIRYYKGCNWTGLIGTAERKPKATKMGIRR
jgi:beta-galactosidase/beta-glucuronidase